MRSYAHELNLLYENLTKLTDIVCVYISEAHAQDEWPIRSSRLNPTNEPVLIDQHKTLNERIQAAKAFQKNFKFKVSLIVDTMENNFERTYSSWPIRFFVVSFGKILFISNPKNQGYFYLEEAIEIIEKI
jgi:uncharacterized protein (DUF1919 family)